MINKQELAKLQELCDNIDLMNIDLEQYKIYGDYIKMLLAKYKIPKGYTIDVSNGQMIKIDWAKRI